MPRPIAARSRVTKSKSSRTRKAAPAPIQSAASFATLTAWSPGEPLFITLARPGAQPQIAESIIPLSGAHLRGLVDARARVLVNFADGDLSRPVVVGLLQDLPTTVELDLPAPDHAQVDGRRVTLTGRDEIELKCGEASITLRRNGRLVMKGTAVETAASGVNRIKGGMVKIN